MARKALSRPLVLILASIFILGAAQAAKAPCNYDDPEGCDHRHMTAAGQPPPVGESPGKTAWPELVGVPARNARTTIEAERPELRVQVVPLGAVVTQDFREDRVRLFVDDENLVAKPPRVG